MIPEVKNRQSLRRFFPVILATALTFCLAVDAAAQYPAAGPGAGQTSALAGSVPSGQASNEV